MIERIPSPSAYAPKIGFSAAVRAGDTVYVAGVSAIDGDGACIGGDDPYAQAKEVLRKIEEALAQAGARRDDVVQTRIYVTDPADWPEVGRAHGEVFADVRPAAAMLVTGLLDPRMKVEIEAVAYAPRP